MLPEVQPPASYWPEDDPRAIAGHKGVLSMIILDMQPFNLVRQRGFMMSNYLTTPSLKLHGPEWYADKLDKVGLM